MGVYNAELFNNLGLCCFYAQQYDMTLTCFERALSLADEVTLAEVWYNIGHVALVSSYCILVNPFQTNGIFDKATYSKTCVKGPLSKRQKIGF